MSVRRRGISSTNSLLDLSDGDLIFRHHRAEKETVSKGGRIIKIARVGVVSEG
jgi:hypothetical protein